MTLLRERIQLKKRSLRTEPPGEVTVRLKQKGSQPRGGLAREAGGKGAQYYSSTNEKNVFQGRNRDK